MIDRSAEEQPGDDKTSSCDENRLRGRAGNDCGALILLLVMVGDFRRRLWAMLGSVFDVSGVKA